MLWPKLSEVGEFVFVACSGAGGGACGGAADRLDAFEMAAFSTCCKVGLIPQAKHGGSGVCAFAVVASKLVGTGLEKLHILQTQVAAVTFCVSLGGR